MPNALHPYLRRLAFLIPFLTLPLLRVQAALDQDDILTKLSPAQIEAQLPDASPISYYFYAERLMKAGDNPDALRWFYVGQLRLRIFLQAQPGQDISPLRALNESIGRPINQYGAHHQDEWLAAIDGALAWDAAHDNALTPKQQFSKIYAAQRDSLEKFKDFIRSHSQQIEAGATGH